ncbi:MAG TPA: hypothetical protein VGS41_16245 [Chthonomonadales bacterium]|nr:hypothetical protein [Chthonomonadales bacterium]
MTQEPATSHSSSPRLRRSLRLRKSIAAAAVVITAILLLLWYVGVFGGNVRAVVPGLVYRSAQLTDGNLSDVLRRQHIRTVINLRGGSSSDWWYRSELRVCRRLGVVHDDIPMSAVHAPPPGELNRLLKDFDRDPYPILFHCQGGADRSGLVGTIYLNVYRDIPLNEAELSQLTWRYGHIAWSRTRAMNQFFDLYRRTAKGAPLRRWIIDRYPALYQGMPAYEK